MAARKNFDGARIVARGNVRILDLGPIEIWDGADLALIRDALTFLIVKRGCRSVGIDMTHVKYVPSGFFGMLFDWFDQGVTIRLFEPQPRIQEMLWFRKFFIPENAHRYILQDCATAMVEEEESVEEITPVEAENGAAHHLQLPAVASPTFAATED